jgi:hypothetical protein
MRKELRQVTISLSGNESRTEEVTTDDLVFGTYFFHFADLKGGAGHVAKWVKY